MPDSITLEYHLANLPTAQHKAGLAGLLLLIEDLRERGHDDVPEVCVEQHNARITIAEPQLQTVFDDWYAADWVEVQSASKWSGKTVKRVETVEVEHDGKKKNEKRYVYDAFIPAGRIFARLYPESAREIWLKLWRDMLWAVLRAQPATRGEFEARANGKPSTTAPKLWKSLQKAHKEPEKPVVESVAGSLLVGAQDRNAERVSFQGRVEQNLLLQFWQIVSPVYVPQRIDLKKEQNQYAGFLLAIPEVAHLPDFLAAIGDFLRSRPDKRRGYRPAASLVDVAGEAGLSFLYNLARHQLDANWSLIASVSAVELYHQEKQGNNVRMLVADRLRPNKRQLKRYERLCDWMANPLFKALQIENVLDESRWYAGAGRYLDHYPAEFFVRPNRVSKITPFGRDARLQFKRIEERLEEDPMSAEEDDQIARRVYRLVGNYVRRRAEERKRRGSGEREAKEKVALDAFLAIRGRSVDDFPNYFTGSLCSVPQFVGKEDEFLMLGNALTRDPERIRALTMLALSAHAWTPQPKGDGTAEAQGAQS